MSPTPAPLPTATAAPTPVTVEAEPAAPEGEALGKLDFEYPVQMAPLSSDTAILQLFVPELLAAAEPVAVTRVETRASAEDATALGRFDAVVYLAPQMRAELASPGLDITAIHPAAQPVVLGTPNQPTSWAWTLRAPETVGKQVMTLSLFREGEAAPLWVGSFRVDVMASGAEAAAAVDPAPPEGPISTATPPSRFAVFQQLSDAASQEPVTVLVGVLGFIGAIAGALITVFADRERNERPMSASASTPRARSGLKWRLRALWFRIKGWWSE